MALWKFFSKKKEEPEVENQESQVDEIEDQEQKEARQEPKEHDDSIETGETVKQETGNCNEKLIMKNEELSKVDDRQQTEEQKIENREKEIENQDQNSQFSIDNSQLDPNEPQTQDPNSESQTPNPYESDTSDSSPDESELLAEDLKTAEKPGSKSWFARLKSGLSKTRDSFTYKMRKILNFGEIDEDTLEELEDLFIQADIGTDLTIKLINEIEKKSIMGELSDTESVINFLKSEFERILERDNKIYFDTTPKVFLVVGVNGAGKTTTIGKLTRNFKDNGKSVLMVAGDTFRAAAIEQLEIWANRCSCQIIKHNEGSDSAAVVFDGVSAGVSRNVDAILVDTAGRLHNKVNLMKELEKIKRVVKKAASDIAVETLLVIDATSGQNGLIQAKTFKQVVDIDGILLTKMDGTAKGGIILPIVNDLNVPVKYIGVGEGIEDLKEFSASDFVNALFD